MSEVANLLEAVPENAEEITHAYIPHHDYAKKYIHRKVDGVNDFDLIDFCRKENFNLLLMGETGAGKTMFPMAYAAANNIPYFSVPCDISIEPTALFGKMMPTDTIGKFQWTDGPVTEMVRNGGILNLSEINGMSPRISLALFQLLDHRRSLTLLGHMGETIVAHPDLVIVADMNPNYRGTQTLNAAFQNRFPIRIPWGYSAVAEDKLVEAKNLLELVRKIRGNNAITTPVGTNMMLEFQRIALRLGSKFALSNFISAFAEGEQAPLKTVLDVYRDKILEDIATIRSGKSTLAGIAELPEDKGWYKKDGKDEYELDELVPAS